MKDLDFKLIDAQTSLVMPAFQKIADFLRSNHIQADWSAEVTAASLPFRGKSGSQCEFRLKVDLVRPGREVFVFFNYDRGPVSETDFTGIPAAKLSVPEILERFKRIFEQEI
jgi:hypothetical protein